LARYAIDFVSGTYGGADRDVVEQVERFHRDSMACGISALAMRTNAPTLLRQEAFCYPSIEPRYGVPCFGSSRRVMPEKAVLANCAAVREWDANGTNFGFHPSRGAARGEFGHNDFYPVVVAAAQQAGWDGRRTVQAMICVDEIRGRLAEVFSLREHKIDHVLHGAIASAAVYGAMRGASVDEIESALGLVVAHWVPFRAIRAGDQLSDSKGAAAAISAEQAVLAVARAMRGFIGPADIFRNPEAVFCWFEKPQRPHESPFDLTLATAGSDFAVMGMHFKLGLYEHQSAGAIEALIDLLQRYPQLAADPGELDRIRIRIYQPALGIIGDLAKRDPRTRQSADHSMVYIVATLLRKVCQGCEPGWETLMLLPEDYRPSSLFDPLTRQLIDRIELVHGGPDYDAKYPDGIPTSLEIEHARLGCLSSGLVMYPAGHARNRREDLDHLLEAKFSRLASLAVDDVDAVWRRFSNVATQGREEIGRLYDFAIRNCVQDDATALRGAADEPN